MDRYLISHTTREERERIVEEALSGGDDCDCSVSNADYAFYQPYIDGLMELRECNMAFRNRYVKGGMEMSSDTGCGWAR